MPQLHTKMSEDGVVGLAWLGGGLCHTNLGTMVCMNNLSTVEVKKGLEPAGQ